MMDLYGLSSEAARLLAPLLPALAEGGKALGGKALEEIVKQVGSTAWEKIKELWEKVGAAVAASPEKQKELAEIAGQQDLPRRTDELQSFLRDLMTREPQAQIQIAKAIQNISHTSNVNITIL